MTVFSARRHPNFAGRCGLSASVGGISADPQFVDPASNDYHLSAGSRAIDAGLNSATDLPSTDFYGNSRIVAGRTKDKPIVDIGAAEFQGTLMRPAISTCPTSKSTGSTTRFAQSPDSSR